MKWSNDQCINGSVYYRFNSSDLVARTHNSHVENSVIRQEKLVPAHAVLTLYLLGTEISNGSIAKQHTRYDFKVITKKTTKHGADDLFVKDLRLDLF